MESPDNEILLNLEWETDIKRALIYARANMDYQNFNYKIFRKILMSNLKEYYDNCQDINIFANKMYSLWTSLPSYI